MAERVTPRRCIICGGLIVARGVPVWTQTIGLTQTIGQGDAPFPVRWAEAHLACSHVLEDDEGEGEGEGEGEEGGEGDG